MNKQHVPKLMNFEDILAYLPIEGFEANAYILKFAKLCHINSQQLVKALLILLFVTLCLIFGIYVDKILFFIVAVLYPIYESIKASRNLVTSKKNAKFWLVYWVCYSLYSCVQDITRLLLGELPFYYILECSFFVWLYHEKTLGADLIHQYILLPIMKKYGYPFGAMLRSKLKSKKKKQKMMEQNLSTSLIFPSEGKTKEVDKSPVRNGNEEQKLLRLTL